MNHREVKVLGYRLLYPAEWTALCLVGRFSQCLFESVLNLIHQICHRVALKKYCAVLI